MAFRRSGCCHSDFPDSGDYGKSASGNMPLPESFPDHGREDTWQGQSILLGSASTSLIKTAEHAGIFNKIMFLEYLFLRP
jgi:hypothetical protein